ncbi:unnamed protein product [Prunus armeniaca]|uniref:CASP-like protein n=1 Tax=Prunus armeniaca TaxID=36596 RepID=A0A6J5WND6_PRUAR|nr:unnamed protein product [Prunus armeniaca]
MQLISNLLATGTCAGFAVTVDTKRLTDADPRFESIDMREFYDKAYASASLLLLAFCSTAMLSIISSYTLPKRVCLLLAKAKTIYFQCAFANMTPMTMNESVKDLYDYYIFPCFSSSILYRRGSMGLKAGPQPSLGQT